nr:MAG TPA: hypothetical protein [Caudoviricetes sp.]
MFNHTNTNTTKRRYYALRWKPEQAFQYDYGSISMWGTQIASVIAFDTQLARDTFVAASPYHEKIAARDIRKFALIVSGREDD